MYLAEIEISNFRNLQHLKLELGPGFNVLYGDNGAGKTSFLEAIYYLALGRSFRSHISRYIIQYEEQQLIVFARVVDEDGATIPLGISRTRKGESELRVAGEAVNTQAQLAHLLPLQLINSSSYQLLEAGPKQRRQFIDWGMFHVEHSFLSCWQRAQRTLKQRNAILKQGDYVARAQIQVWDQELVAASQILHDLRSKYVIELIPIVQQLIETLLERTDVTLEYYPGWDISRPLGELLQEHLARDLKLGYTTIGPQKADLRIRIRSLPVQDVLSRGQQKLLLFALRLAEGVLLYQQKQQRCIYLIDDLPAELDQQHRSQVIDVLTEIKAQTFITGIAQVDLDAILVGKEAKMFHVEHGGIAPIA